MDNQSQIGNLQSYFGYASQHAKKYFGSYSFRDKKLWNYQSKVQQMLETLALHGSLSTWDMAKTQSYLDSTSIRALDKECRRLLIGRKDRGKVSPGVLDTGLVISEAKSDKVGNSYRLSLHGILYCLEVLNMNEKDIDTMAKKYSKHLPMVFGKWDYLKEQIGKNVYHLKTMAAGYKLTNQRAIMLFTLPIFEISNYVYAKYQDYYESISDHDLSEQISYWYYTNLLSWYLINDKKTGLKQWQEIFSKDSELRIWYFSFVDEFIEFYHKRFENLNSIKPKILTKNI